MPVPAGSSVQCSGRRPTRPIAITYISISHRGDGVPSANKWPHPKSGEEWRCGDRTWCATIHTRADPSRRVVIHVMAAVRAERRLTPRVCLLLHVKELTALYDEICRSCGGAQLDIDDRFHGSVRRARMAKLGQLRLSSTRLSAANTRNEAAA